ncbi:MAG: aldo/keto reductase [Paracoccus sp. (in: a-proteobacteria)]|uniref:aldo/keto reductase n=1 Tax=Paracoccus sp. TaxID=267 RepID=UPI0026E05345|nr:aldo/keto reductase [Paracoccus sp. (in: a-proteobacteria)]MDO5612921.1 aldo/keto reductase [Paracoccus sp. (in: a-proteobacteria)]
MQTLTLNNGVTLPSVGLGVFQSPPEQTVAAVKTALADGYRLIDTAAAYGNEAEVGEGLRQSGLPRDQVVIQTKIWISDYGFDSALHAFDRSSRKLGLDMVDVWLLHQPLSVDFDRTIATWKAAERLLAEGRIRAIGVSNFSPAELDRIAAECEVVPALNQVELHPFFTQPELRATHERLGILTQAWSPIGGVQRYWGDDKRPEDDPLTHPAITAIAEAHGKTPAQVVLRWQIQLGHSVLPKSVNPARIAQNIDLFDFTLTADDIAAIEALDTGKRGGPEPTSINPENYTFVIED